MTVELRVARLARPSRVFASFRAEPADGLDRVTVPAGADVIGVRAAGALHTCLDVLALVPSDRGGEHLTDYGVELTLASVLVGAVLPPSDAPPRYIGPVAGRDGYYAFLLHTRSLL